MASQEKKVPIQVSFNDPVHFFALGFGSGLAAIAPGTFGTVAAIPLYVALVQFNFSVYLAFLVLSLVAGIWVCGESARRIGVHDHHAIAWDEVAGYLLTMAPFVPSLASVFAGFLAFRLFDIVKPWPIRWLDERVHGGLGIMLDDVVAALFAAALMWLIAMFVPVSFAGGLALRTW